MIDNTYYKYNSLSKARFSNQTLVKKKLFAKESINVQNLGAEIRKYRNLYSL